MSCSDAIATVFRTYNPCYCFTDLYKYCCWEVCDNIINQGDEEDVGAAPERKKTEEIYRESIEEHHKFLSVYPTSKEHFKAFICIPVVPWLTFSLWYLTLGLFSFIVRVVNVTLARILFFGMFFWICPNEITGKRNQDVRDALIESWHFLKRGSILLLGSIWPLVPLFLLC